MSRIRVLHTEGKVDHRSTSTLLGDDVIHSPIETLKGGRSRTFTSLEDLDRDNLGLVKLV